MSNIYDFQDREAIEQGAAEWLIRLDSDKVMNPEEMARLRNWMHRSPAHREELISFGDFWSNQSLVALPISLEALYYEVPTPKAENEKAAWYQQIRPVAMAASLFLVVGAVLLANSIWFPGVGGSSSAHSEHYVTAIGQQRTISLSDGSILYLNTNSQVKIDFNQQFRNILLLQGEAHFEVAKAPERPFRVYAGKGRVQAVGTAFTVYLRGKESVDVTVTEGKVALAVLEKVEGASDADIEAKAMPKTASEVPKYTVSISVDELGVLEAGQASRIVVAQENNEPSHGRLEEVKVIEQQELERLGAWRSGVLIFSGNSLEEVVAEIGRYTTLSIEIVDPELKAIRIGGRFSANNTSELFDALEANFNLKVTYLDYNRVQIAFAKNK